METGLAELVVNDLHGQPGSLPLLAHALRETWLRRDGRRLTIAGYRDAGGVREAIARTADGVLAGLNDPERAVSRDLLLRMVELRDDGDDARRWVDLHEVQQLPGDGPAMLDRLAAARLVTVESDWATLAHEALLTAWPALRDWLRDERANLLLRQQLRRRLDAWEQEGRSEGDLYRGPRLDAALEWRAAAHTHLTAAEVEFLDASHDVDERRGSQGSSAATPPRAAARCRRGRARARDRGGSGRVQPAPDRRSAGRRRRPRPTRLGVAGPGVVEARRRRPAGRGGVDRRPGAATDGALLTAVYSDPSFVADIRPGTVAAAVRFSPSDDALFANPETPGEPVVRYDIATGQVTELPLGQGDQAVFPFLPVDDRHVVFALRRPWARPEPRLRLVDIETGTVKATAELDAPPSHLALSPSGERVVVTTFGTGSRAATVEVFDLPSLSPVGSAAQPGPLGEGPWFSTSAWIDDDRVAVGSPSGRMLVWRPSTDEVVLRLNDPPAPGSNVARALQVTDDGSTLLAANPEGDGMLAFDLATGLATWLRARCEHLLRAR